MDILFNIMAVIIVILFLFYVQFSMLRSKFITLQQEYYDVPDDETLEFISDTLKKAEELSTLKVDIEILKKTVEELSQKITPQ